MVQFERKVFDPQINVTLVLAKERFRGLNGEGNDQVRWWDLANLAPNRLRPTPIAIWNEFRKLGAKLEVFQHDWRETIQIKTFTFEIPLEMGQKLFNVYPFVDYVHKIDVLMADIRQQLLPNRRLRM